jgi:hypothetical protein
MRAVKQAFDPAGFDESGQAHLSDLVETLQIIKLMVSALLL